MKPLVLYHGGCRDGFAAAWVAHKVMPDAEFRAAYYGTPAPIADAIDREVYVVDFSYPIAEMIALAGAASRLVVLDHHKTAQEAMAGFSAPNATVVFDMKRSGAGIASDWFLDQSETQTSPRHWLVDYVEDRDLWRHALPHSEEINSYIGVLPFDFAVWDSASMNPAIDYLLQGQCVIAKVKQYVAEVKKNARRWTFEGHDVPLVNAPQVDISELLSAMCDGETFAMGYWQRADGVFQYSLRSRGDFDVSELAKRHGGGGHKNAAGFQSATLL